MIGFDEFMKEQVLFIAPFKKLAEDAYLVIEERFSDKKDLFKVVEADLVEAEEVVKKYINDGIEVIVSRGGTASLLEKEGFHVNQDAINTIRKCLKDEKND